MPKFNVYASQMIFYKATIEANSAEEAEKLADMVDFDEFKEYDSDWQFHDIEEVENEQ